MTLHKAHNNMALDAFTILIFNTLRTKLLGHLNSCKTLNHLPPDCGLLKISRYNNKILSYNFIQRHNFVYGILNEKIHSDNCLDTAYFHLEDLHSDGKIIKTCNTTICTPHDSIQDCIIKHIEGIEYIINITTNGKVYISYVVNKRIQHTYLINTIKEDLLKKLIIEFEILNELDAAQLEIFEDILNQLELKITYEKEFLYLKEFLQTNYLGDIPGAQQVQRDYVGWKCMAHSTQGYIIEHTNIPDYCIKAGETEALQAESNCLKHLQRTLNNSHIVKYYASQSAILNEGNRTFIVIKKYDLDLKKYIQTIFLTPDIINYIYNDIFAGLNELHKAGYIYQDLKPENIFVDNKIPNRPEFYIGDLGLVLKAGTTINGIYGSYGYFYPYIYNVKKATPSIDYWGFWIIMYNCLTQIKTGMNYSYLMPIYQYNTISPLLKNYIVSSNNFLTRFLNLANDTKTSFKFISVDKILDIDNHECSAYFNSLLKYINHPSWSVNDELRWELNSEVESNSNIYSNALESTNFKNDRNDPKIDIIIKKTLVLLYLSSFDAPPEVPNTPNTPNTPNANTNSLFISKLKRFLEVKQPERRIQLSQAAKLNALFTSCQFKQIHKDLKKRLNKFIEH